MHLFVRTTLLLLAGVWSSFGASSDGLTLGEFFAHDPFVLAYGPTKTYYLYTAVGAQANGERRAGVVAYKSQDLHTWQGPQTVFTVPDGIWANPADGAWAPEIHQYQGKFYLFVTLHNNSQVIEEPTPLTHPIYQGKPAVHHKRGTQIFVSDGPEGPFRLLGKTAAPPADFMTLDGTFFVEDGTPYMVYAHEWVQILDGTIEAIALKPDLSGGEGQPFYLFKGSDAPWLNEPERATNRSRTYVTDGPFLYRTGSGRLLMLWSSYRHGQYMQTLAYSESGRLRGPWRQASPLVGDDSGHGMLFRTFEGKLMLVLHQPFRQAHAKIFEMIDDADTIRVKSQLP